MNLEGELRHEANAPEGGRTLGEAANRWVTFQMVMGVVGVCIFLFMLLETKKSKMHTIIAGALTTLHPVSLSLR